MTPKLKNVLVALEFYRGLPFAQKYFLFSGFPREAIAPVLEDLAPALRRLFVQLPSDFKKTMFRELCREPVGAVR